MRIKKIQYNQNDLAPLIIEKKLKTIFPNIKPINYVETRYYYKCYNNPLYTYYITYSNDIGVLHIDGPNNNSIIECLNIFNKEYPSKIKFKNDNLIFDHSSKYLVTKYKLTNEISLFIYTKHYLEISEITVELIYPPENENYINTILAFIAKKQHKM